MYLYHGMFHKTYRAKAIFMYSPIATKHKAYILSTVHEILDQLPQGSNLRRCNSNFNSEINSK